MSEVNLTFDCPKCGGKIVWDSIIKQMTCPYCDSVFTKEEMEKIIESGKDKLAEKPLEEKQESENLKGNMLVHICQSCGGEIVGDENSIATQCVYCGSPTIMTKNIEGILKPDFIIPFQIDKKGAKKALQEFYKKKRLLPNFFAQENHIDKITGVYVPFWLFQCRVQGDFAYDATKIRTWSDMNYKYIETSYYKLYRKGSIYFDNVPVDGAKKIDDDYMNAIEPFSYDQLEDFRPEYMSGYFADKYDNDKDVSYPIVKERICNTTKSAFSKTAVNFSSLTEAKADIDIARERVSYAMLPVWLLTTKYKGETYRFAMNGQTGKFAGELPIDKKKAFFYGGGIFAAVMLLAQILIFLI